MFIKSTIFGRKNIYIFFNILLTILFSIFFFCYLIDLSTFKSIRERSANFANRCCIFLTSFSFSPLSWFLSRQLSLSLIDVYNSDEEAPPGLSTGARSRSGRSTLHVQYFLITLYTALEVGPRSGSWTGPLLEGGENGAHRGGLLRGR